MFYFYFFFDYIRKIINYYKFQIALNKYKLRQLKYKDIIHFKKSNTLFVLGSGSSILGISNAEWEIIKRNDTIGVNDWILHDFVPTYYLFEWYRDLNKGKDFSHNLIMRQTDYTNVPILIKDLLYNDNLDLYFKSVKEIIGKNWFGVFDYIIPGKNENDFRKGIKLLRKLTGFTNKMFFSTLHTSRSSIISAIFLGVKLGYSEIVLCGVDLNTSLYFYEVDKRKYENKGMILPKNEPTLSGLHSTADKAFIPLTVDEIIYNLNDIILKDYGISLKVGFQSSLLFPKVSSYFD